MNRAHLSNLILEIQQGLGIRISLHLPGMKHELVQPVPQGGKDAEDLPGVSVEGAIDAPQGGAGGKETGLDTLPETGRPTSGKKPLSGSG